MKPKAKNFYSLIYGKFFSDLIGSGGRKKKKSSENDQVTGNFQSFFFKYLQKKKTVKVVSYM